LGGSLIVYAAVAALWDGRVGADLALAIAMLAALALKEYWVGAEVVLIAMVGESLEALTFARTHREIKRVLDLRPRRVRVRRGDEELEVPIDEAVLGDVAIVRPGERLPVDGTILAGRSTVDQSTLTGESLPVDKGERDQVFAGTLNQFGALELRIDAVGEDTTLGQVIHLVLEAQHDKAKVERIADRLARYFLPLVLSCASVTFLFSNFAVLREPGWPALDRFVWMPTLAVLVVTCPCALVLATPAAMMAALAWLARRGVLMKGGAALERMATVRRIAFDKTGTLTTGRLELGDCLSVAGRTEDEVLRLAAAAEQSSEHVIGRVVVEAARSRGLSLPLAAEFAALPGAGVLARLPAGAAPDNTAPGPEVVVGNRRLMGERQINIPSEVDGLLARLEATAQTPLLVALDGEVLGAIGVRDTIRPEAAGVVRELRELGIAEIVLLTGDRPAAAAEVARQLGIDRWQAELRPAEKARWLAEWRRDDQASGVAMVGDGINDAPALASADVGLALAGVGSDLAAEAGDLLLMGEPLAPLPDVLRMSRETVRVIRQNIIVFAFFVNFAGVALTAWIMPAWSEAWLRRAPVAAALFHQCGSVLVLVNSMRLLWFDRWPGSLLGRVESALAALCWRGWLALAPLVESLRGLWRWRRPLARGLATLAVAAYLTQVVVVVEPDEVAVVRRFGRFHALLGPGPHLRLPPPWDAVAKEKPARVRTIELGLRSADPAESGAVQPIEWNTPHDSADAARRTDEAVALTGDQSLVELGASIQYRISDVRAYHFTVGDPPAVLRAAAESVVRQAVAGRPLLAKDEGASPAAPLEILTAGRGELER
jgi:Cu+-exporting ATPase